MTDGNSDWKPLRDLRLAPRSKPLDLTPKAPTAPLPASKFAPVTRPAPRPHMTPKFSDAPITADSFRSFLRKPLINDEAKPVDEIQKAPFREPVAAPIVPKLDDLRTPLPLPAPPVEPVASEPAMASMTEETSADSFPAEAFQPAAIEPPPPARPIRSPLPIANRKPKQPVPPPAELAAPSQPPTLAAPPSPPVVSAPPPPILAAPPATQIPAVQPPANDSARDPEPSRKFSENFAALVLMLADTARYRYINVSELIGQFHEPMQRDCIAVALGGANEELARSGKPAAFILWASVSDEVDAKIKEQIETGVFPLRLKPEDWRSGTHTWLLDVLAPNPNIRAAALSSFMKSRNIGTFNVHPVINRLFDVETLRSIGLVAEVKAERKSA